MNYSLNSMIPVINTDCNGKYQHPYEKIPIFSIKDFVVFENIKISSSFGGHVIFQKCDGTVLKTMHFNNLEKMIGTVVNEKPILILLRYGRYLSFIDINMEMFHKTFHIDSSIIPSESLQCIDDQLIFRSEGNFMGITLGVSTSNSHISTTKPYVISSARDDDLCVFNYTLVVNAKHRDKLEIKDNNYHYVLRAPDFAGVCMHAIPVKTRFLVAIYINNIVILWDVPQETPVKVWKGNCCYIDPTTRWLSVEFNTPHKIW